MFTHCRHYSDGHCLHNIMKQIKIEYICYTRSIKVIRKCLVVFPQYITFDISYNYILAEMLPLSVYSLKIKKGTS